MELDGTWDLSIMKEVRPWSRNKRVKLESVTGHQVSPSTQWTTHAVTSSSSSPLQAISHFTSSKRP